MGEFLDTFAHPVFVVDETGDIRTANRRAQHMLDNGWLEMGGFRDVEVSECRYSILPGGCGQPLHCLGCTMRRLVTATFETGKEFLQVPASLHTGESRVYYAVSARRLGSMVLLTINELSEPVKRSENGRQTTVSHPSTYFLP